MDKINNHYFIIFVTPVQERTRSKIEDGFQDVIQELTQDDPESKHLCVLHRNVIIYFLARLLNLRLVKVCKIIKIPHCSVLVVNQSNVSHQTIPMHVVYHFN